MALALYATLWRLLTPLWLARLWWRGRREPLYRARWPERLAFYGAGREASGRVWIHAVSLGETRAAAPLVEELRAQYPGLRLLLTHSTATGWAAGRSLLRAGDAQTWLPADTPGAWRRFFRHWRPRVGLLMETEIWPVMQAVAQEQGLSLVLVNARLSSKSQGQALRWPRLLLPAARRLRLVLAQSMADAERFQALGIERVEVMGNLKFDARPEPALLQTGRTWRQALHRPVVLMASSREGEEAALLSAWKRQSASFGDSGPLLLLVPRHPQRFDEVAQALQSQGWHWVPRSHWADSPTPDALQAQVWLGDSLGEMPLYYAMADVALLGGSFAPLGGQNLMEAAACACPMLMGPHTFNFEAAAQWSLEAGAAQRLPNLDQAVEQALALLRQAPQQLTEMRRAALRFSAQHQGAAQRTAARLAPWISPESGQ